jgi:hypothetical protein
VTTYTQQTFTGQRIVIDGHRYENCTFKNCDVVFQGGPPPNFLNCHFDAPQFSFDGPAASTVLFIRSLIADPGMAPVIRDLLPELFQRRQ